MREYDSFEVREGNREKTTREINPEAIGRDRPAELINAESLVNIADHVVGPEDDAKDIFNNQLSKGDTVWLGAGTHEYKNIQPSVDNVTVYGSKDAVLLLSGDANTSPSTNSEKDNLFILDGRSGWRFYGVTFDGNSANLTGYDQNTEDAMNGLAIVSSSDIVVDGCTIRNVRQNGIREFDCQDVRVTNCYFENNRTHFLAYGNTWLSKSDGQPPTDISVTDSVFIGTVAGMTNGNPYGVYLSGATADATISDCIIRGQGDMTRGINLNNTYRNTVTGCVIEGVTARGIAFAAGATENTVGFNSINTPNARAIYGETGANDHNTIIANAVKGSELHGIDIRDGTGWLILFNEIVNPDQRGFNTSTAGVGVFGYNGLFGVGADSNATTNRGINISDGTWDIGPNIIDDNNAVLNVSVGLDSAATDCSIERQVIISGPRDIADSGTRTRYEGVIGGGLIGGKDIGSLTGASAGDKAMANGTTATNADTLWILKSTGDWQRVDGGATITPA